MQDKPWGTLVVLKTVGGRAVILNESNRGLWQFGARYYNHKLKLYPDGCMLNVTVRVSPKGRRMVQKIIQKD